MIALMRCLHCGGQLREDCWEPGALTCWQCGRAPAPETPPTQRPERELHWNPAQDARLMELYLDESLTTYDIAEILASTPSSVHSRLQRLRKQGVLTHRRACARPKKQEQSCQSALR